MKFAIALSAVAAGTLAAAQPHRHAHRHQAHPVKREADATATVLAFQLDGSSITEDAVCQGIADGTLEWADGVAPAGACELGASATSTASAAAVATSSVAVEEENGANFIAVATTASSTYSVSSASASSTSAAAASSSEASSTGSSSSSSATGLTADFPDGTISCDTFPSDYGAVALDYLGLDGWTGIQQVTITGEYVTDIVTSTSGGCISGAMCSYACPAGYQKSQWPSTQGSTGQSVGGLYCKNGLLYLTNSDYSTLCIEGTGGVYVKNQLSEQVAVCRTDYPGTESETVPLAVSAGSTEDLTCPDGDTYFKWEGATTSAQYYVNPKGYSTSDACKWGDGSEDIGNWAPINLGVGYTSGGTWLSIIPNTPTTDATLDFDVTIEGDDLSGSCSYSGGVFTSDSGTSTSGCTVSLRSIKISTTSNISAGRAHVGKRILRFHRFLVVCPSWLTIVAVFHFLHVSRFCRIQFTSLDDTTMLRDLSLSSLGKSGTLESIRCFRFTVPLFLIHLFISLPRLHTTNPCRS